MDGGKGSQRDELKGEPETTETKRGRRQKCEIEIVKGGWKEKSRGRLREGEYV